MFRIFHLQDLRIKKYSATRPKPSVVTTLVKQPWATLRWARVHPLNITFLNDSTGMLMGVRLRMVLISGSKLMMGNTAPLVNS